jgi:hypothetical protein
MADSFIEVDITTDPSALADVAVEKLRATWPEWEPEEADQEVIVIEAVAPMASESASAAAVVPAAIFRTYGENLADLPPTEAVAAQALLTFTVVEEGTTLRAVGASVLIEAGTEVVIDTFAFATEEDVTVPAGETVTEGVIALATEEGAAANDLPGDSVEPLTSLTSLVSVTLDEPTSLGQDAELQAAYENRLSQELELSAKTLVVPRDFEKWALIRFPNDIGRVVARHVGDRHVEVTLTDSLGEIVPTLVKDALEEDYQFYRLANTTFDMLDATYTTVSVTYAVKLYPGVLTDDALARIDEMLTAALSPAEFGIRRDASEDERQSLWVNDPVIRKNKLIDLIGDVPGVNYVDSLTIAASAASLTTSLAGANNDLTFTADTAGSGGNSIRVRYVVAGTSTALSVSVSTNDITVNVATNGGGAPTSTAAQVKTAVDASGPAAALINTANAAGNDGTGVVAAMAFTNLAGGASVDGSGNLVLAGAVALPRAGTFTGSVV